MNFEIEPVGQLLLSNWAELSGIRVDSHLAYGWKSSRAMKSTLALHTLFSRWPIGFYAIENILQF